MRVGNGKSIRFFHSNQMYGDKWMPRLNSLQIISSLMLGADAKVENLIDQISTQWKRELVAENFLATDAELILSTHLSWRSVDDKLIWHHAKNGLYSVWAVVGYGLFLVLDLDMDFCKTIFICV